MIIPVYKNIGESTHLLAQLIGQKIAKITNNPEDKKATHTGTLDPMARGVVIVLTGEDRFKKQQLSNNKKSYEFEILFGVSTDSLDLLGLSTNIIDTPVIDDLESKLKLVINQFIGQQTQSQPFFSAKRIGGLSYFDQAKKGIKLAEVNNNIEIFSLLVIEKRIIPIKELSKKIRDKILLIKGNFRQKQILGNWQKTFNQLKNSKVEKLMIIKLETQVSKRTYIRSLVRDIANKLNIPATTYSITRTKNGKFTIDDCQFR